MLAIGVVFQETLLNEAQLENVNLSGMVLAEIHSALRMVMKETNCRKATVRNVLLSNAVLINVSWSTAIINGFAVIESILRNNKFNEWAKISQFVSQSTILSNIDFSHSTIRESMFLAPVTLQRTFSSGEETLTYYICGLGFNVNFDEAVIESTLFLGDRRALQGGFKDQKNLKLFLNQDSEIIKHSLKLSTEELAIMNSYNTFLDKLVHAKWHNINNADAGSSFLLLGGGCVALLAFATIFFGPAGTAVTAKMCFAAGAGSASTTIGAGRLIESPSKNEFKFEGKTFLFRTSFKNVTLNRVLFASLYTQSCLFLEETKLAGGSLFEKCRMPNEKASQRLRYVGARVNNIADDKTFWNAWGLNPKDQSSFETITKFFVAISDIAARSFGINVDIKSILTILFKEKEEDD